MPGTCINQRKYLSFSNRGELPYNLTHVFVHLRLTRTFQLACSDHLDIGGVVFEFGLPTVGEAGHEEAIEEEEAHLEDHDELDDHLLDDHLLDDHGEMPEFDDDFEEKPKKKKPKKAPAPPKPKPKPKPKAKPEPKPKKPAPEPKKAEPKKVDKKAEAKKAEAKKAEAKKLAEAKKAEAKKAEEKKAKAEAAKAAKAESLKRKREKEKEKELELDDDGTAVPALPAMPLVNPYQKPEYSYATMIGEAINATEDKRLTLSELYESIMAKYPYFRYDGAKWRVGCLVAKSSLLSVLTLTQPFRQNSIRHQLSLNKAFTKVARDPEEDPSGKGGYWVIKPDFQGRFEDGPRVRGSKGKGPREDGVSDGNASETAKKKRKVNTEITISDYATYGLLDGQENALTLTAFDGVANSELGQFVADAEMVKFLRRPGDAAAFEYEQDVPDVSTLMKRLHPQFKLLKNADLPPFGQLEAVDLLELVRTMPKIGSDEGRDVMNKVAAEMLAQKTMLYPPVFKRRRREEENKERTSDNAVSLPRPLTEPAQVAPATA